MEILGKIICCWLLADFITGAVHWWEDTYSKSISHWPIIGPEIAIPNQVHHAQPQVMLEGSYWFRNYTTMIPSFVAAGIMFLLFGPTIWMLVFVFASQSNQIHGLAHQKANTLVRMLQDMGIFQSPRQHSVHHTSPNDVSYCVMSNFLNPILDRIGFWRILESLVYISTCIKPNRS